MTSSTNNAFCIIEHFRSQYRQTHNHHHITTQPTIYTDPRPTDQTNDPQTTRTARIAVHNLGDLNKIRQPAWALFLASIPGRKFLSDGELVLDAPTHT